MKINAHSKNNKALNKLLLDSVFETKEVSTISALLEAGANPNCRYTAVDGKGLTPLMIAAQKYFVPEESRKIIRAFLKAGANPRLTASHHITALDFAKFADNRTFARQLKRAQQKP